MRVPRAAIPVTRSAGQYSRSLAIASFRALWSANFTWSVARWKEQLAIGWITYNVTHSPFLVALLEFYRSLPLFLIGIFGGILGDRYDRQRIVLILGAVNVGCMSVVAVLSFSGSLDYLTLVVAEVIMGVSMAIDWPSRRALTLDIVGRELLANANALDSAGMNVSRIVGPLLSGGIIAVLGPTTSFFELMPVFAVDILRSGSIGLGVLSAVDGLGSLLGTLYLAGAASHGRNGLIFWSGSARGSLAIVGFAPSQTFVVAGVTARMRGLREA